MFWLGLVVTAIASIAIMTRGRYAILLGLLLFVCGSLMVRISCELIILLFRIYESLHNIEKRGRTSVA